LVTLEELILLVRGLNAKTGRRTGLLIETKAPEWHRATAGLPLEAALLDLLAAHGMSGPDSGAVVQSFDADHLRRLRAEHRTDLPLMWLTSTLLDAAVLDEVAEWAEGVNPNRAALEEDGADAFLERARGLGLRTFCWTFNANEDAMRRYLFGHGIDGVITNNPDVGVRAAASA
jgi:glycerophosphoryl diester phosphodiesterase